MKKPPFTKEDKAIWMREYMREYRRGKRRRTVTPKKNTSLWTAIPKGN